MVMDTEKSNNSVYRAGFVEAFWGNINNPSSRTRLQEARRENTIHNVSDLYHYTTIAGFQGIIQSGGFWASDNRFLNDAEEMHDGARLAGRVLAYRARKTKNPDIKNILLSVREKALAKPTEGILVVCFSTVRDSLEQWRGYGDSGGICIRLTNQNPGQRHVFFAPQQLPFQAVYGFRQKAVLLLSIIRRFEREYELDRRVMTNNWPPDHDQHYVEKLWSAISGRTISFKNESFKQESEVRLAIHYSYQDDYEGGLKFRATPVGLIPYLCTGDIKGDSGLLPLVEVIVGPQPHQALIIESIEKFLRHNHYEVPVTSSTVPYRT